MDSKGLKRTLRCMGVGLWIGSVPSLSSYAQHGSGRVRQPDPLIGKWIMIQDNGTGAAGTTADFRPDGTVVFTHNGKKTTEHYKREPGRAWVDRRAAELGRQSKGGVMDMFRKPGVEMIEYADQGGKFVDYGGSLLTLDPNRRVLYNMLTQLWCRPGEEARIKKKPHPNPVKSQPAPHTAEEEGDVAEALYRYLLAQARQNSCWEGVQVIFLSRNDKDPDALLLRRFQNSPLPVKVVSASRNGKRWWVEDKVTGQKGVIVFVDRIRWINNTQIQVRGGFGLEGKSGMSATFHMLNQGSQWRVERTSDEDIY